MKTTTLKTRVTIAPYYDKMKQTIQIEYHIINKTEKQTLWYTN